MKKRPFLMVLLVILTVYTGGQVLIGVTDNPLFEALALAFQSAVTVLGIVVIIYQMKRGNDTNEFKFFIQLTKDLINDPGRMKIFEQLQDQYGKSGKGKPMNSTEIMRYLTFFESVYIALRNRIVSMEVIDETLAYYFFLAVHNEQVQKLNLVKHAKYYKEIYLLHAEWCAYRRKRGKEIMGEKNSLEIKCPDYGSLVRRN